jgi:hypothetical protein
MLHYGILNVPAENRLFTKRPFEAVTEEDSHISLRRTAFIFDRHSIIQILINPV